MRKKSKNKIICLGYLFLFILFSVTVTCYWGLKWYLSTYHVKFAEFIFTILSPMKGTGGDSVRDGVIYCCPRINKGSQRKQSKKTSSSLKERDYENN